MSTKRATALRRVRDANPTPGGSAGPSPAVPSLSLPDGASVVVQGAAVELRDPVGRLLIRYEAGSVEISAPAGDLTLAAAGRVVVRGEDVDIEARGELRQRAGRVSTLAGALVQEVEHYELKAIRIAETARDVYREAVDLCHTRAGRARTVVKDIFSL
ncbi:MAG TPA: hypothetical protein VLS89_13705, partial [Candidatus Nanopelagicales bacterium]|nr:hypothetical protein [Candidatus Nanopelagicales bacterium]